MPVVPTAAPPLAAEVREAFLPCSGTHTRSPAERRECLQRFALLEDPALLEDFVPALDAANRLCADDLVFALTGTDRVLFRGACRLTAEHSYSSAISKKSCTQLVLIGDVVELALAHPSSTMLDDCLLAWLVQPVLDALPRSFEGTNPDLEHLMLQIVCHPAAGPRTFAMCATRRTDSDRPLELLEEVPDPAAVLAARLVRDGYRGSRDRLADLTGLLATAA